MNIPNFNSEFNDTLLILGKQVYDNVPMQTVLKLRHQLWKFFILENILNELIVPHKGNK